MSMVELGLTELHWHGMVRPRSHSEGLPALREVLLNAVVHRDYSNPSDIQIKIFDDGITFFSPGKLFSGLTIDDLQTDNYQSHLRNKLIAEAFYLTKNIEKYGSGFIRIRKELESYPEVSFSVEELGGGILVAFQINGRVNGGVSGGVSGGVKNVLDYLRKHPGAKTHEIATAIGLAERTLQRLLKKLKDERKIRFKGAPKTGGYFVLEDGE